MRSAMASAVSKTSAMSGCTAFGGAAPAVRAIQRRKGPAARGAGGTVECRRRAESARSIRRRANFGVTSSLW